MTSTDRVERAQGAFPALPATLGQAVAHWRHAGGIRPLAGHAGKHGAHGSLWVEYGHVQAYPYWSRAAGTYVDPDADRAVYVGTAFLVASVMFDRGANTRNGTHYRIAASILDELLMATMRCGACRGSGRLCEHCCGTGIEPATDTWRCDRCGIHPRDFRERISPVYQLAFGRLIALERDSLDVARKAGA